MGIDQEKTEALKNGVQDFLGARSGQPDTGDC